MNTSNGSIQSEGSLSTAESNAHLLVLKGITVVNIITVTYVLACFLRHGLKNKVFCQTTTNSSRTTGQTKLFIVAMVIFFLCLSAVVLTQVLMIIKAFSTDVTATDNSSVCSIMNTMRNCICSVINTLMYGFIWYFQQLFYERSAMRHLRTKPFVAVTYITLALIVTNSVVAFCTFDLNNTYGRTKYGCIINMAPLQGQAQIVFAAGRSLPVVMLLMLIGLFIYPLYATKTNKNRPSEGLAKTIMHRIVRRGSISLLVFIGFAVVRRVMAFLILNDSPAYVLCVISDITVIVQCLAVVMCLENRRKIIMWWLI